MFSAITRLNPTGNTYRVHVGGDNTIRIETFGGSVEVFGSIIDRLGEYEALCLTPDEIYEALRMTGKLPKAAVEARKNKSLYR